MEEKIKNEKQACRNLYKWQKIILWVIGILTFISVTTSTHIINIGYFLDLIIAISINLLMVGIIFVVGNWIYKKFRDETKPIQIDERKN